jgi:hypothetical protein
MAAAAEIYHTTGVYEEKAKRDKSWPGSTWQEVRWILHEELVVKNKDTTSDSPSDAQKK